MRKICDIDVPAIGLGRMNLSHAYGSPPSRDVAVSVVEKALGLGLLHFDTAALSGFGANETLLGPVLKPHRDRSFLASKGGLKGVAGKRVIDVSLSTGQLDALDKLINSATVSGPQYNGTTQKEIDTENYETGMQ